MEFHFSFNQHIKTPSPSRKVRYESLCEELEQNRRRSSISSDQDQREKRKLQEENRHLRHTIQHQAEIIKASEKMIKASEIADQMRADQKQKSKAAGIAKQAENNTAGCVIKKRRGSQVARTSQVQQRANECVNK